MNNLFNGCTGLTGTIPEKLFFNSPNITTFYATFEGCTGLTGAIPENLFINQALIISVQGCFRNCSGLSDSIIKISSKKITEAYQFCYGVNAKITVYIPKGAENPFNLTSNVTVVEYDM